MNFCTKGHPASDKILSESAEAVPFSFIYIKNIDNTESWKSSEMGVSVKWVGVCVCVCVWMCVDVQLA